MLGLILETSTEKGLIVLSNEGGPISWKALAGGAELSKTIALEVKNLLGASRPVFIAVGTGPGSYTGIRVGVALGQALSFGWRVPLMGFGSLIAFAPDVLTPVLVDARTPGFYVLKKANDLPLLLTPAAASIALKNAPLLASPHPALIQKRLILSSSWIETAPDPQRLSSQIFSQFRLSPSPPTLSLFYTPREV